jgi:Eco57I restriction-modification methylase
LTPKEYGRLFDARGNVTATLKEAKEIKRTSVGPILVPAEVVRDRDLIAKYSELLHDAIARKDSFQEFMRTCKDESIPTNSRNTHSMLYTQLQTLEAAKKNKIWARIIRNSFAPIFEGVFDFVAGNPPWVNWDSLPPEYREDSKELWFETGLFSLSGKEGRLGGAKKDLSTLMLYVATDSYLKKGGKLGFLITQTIFKTKGAGDGFRRFRYGNAGPTMRVFRVDDFASFNPFEDASNWTSAIFLERDEETKPPVPYYRWELKPGASPDEVVPEKCKKQLSVRREEAWPIDKLRPRSPWITAEPQKLAVLSKAIGQSDYRGYAGMTTWLDGVFWVAILRDLGAAVLIEKTHETMFQSCGERYSSLAGRRGPDSGVSSGLPSSRPGRSASLT